MKFRKVKRKSQDKFIKLAGGYTKREYNKILTQCREEVEACNSKALANASANAALYKALGDLENYARKVLYGEDLDIWAKKMYECLHLNKFALLLYHLNNPNAVYRIDTSLSMEHGFTTEQIKKSCEEYIPPMTQGEIIREMNKFKTEEELEDENIEQILNIIENKNELD